MSDEPTPPPFPPAEAAEPSPAPVEPPASPSGPRARLPLGRLLFGLALVLGGLGWLLDLTGAVELDWGLLWPVALIVVGVGLVIASWEGRGGGGLVTIGVVLTLLLLAGTAVEVPLGGGVGDRVERPTSPRQIPRRYELTAGKLTIELDRLRWDPSEVPGTVRVRAGVGMGQLVVEVGEGFPCVSVRARAGLGEVTVFGERAEGIAPEYRTEATCLAAPVLELELSVGLGEVEVRGG